MTILERAENEKNFNRNIAGNNILNIGGQADTQYPDMTIIGHRLYKSPTLTSFLKDLDQKL